MAQKKVYYKLNDCSQFKCKETRVHLSQVINPNCLTSYEVFSLVSIRYYKPILYITLVLAFLMNMATLNRKFNFMGIFCKQKKIKWSELGTVYETNHCVFAFQGLNLPDDQWFLEMELSKDYNNTLVSRQDYVNLTREINQLCRWKKKNKFLYSAIKIFCPIIEKSILLKGRKAVVKSMSNYIATKNEQLVKEKANIEMELWHDSAFCVAQLIIKSLTQELKDPQPIVIQLSGKLDIDDPITINLNPTLLNTHLWLHHQKDSEMMKLASYEIRKKLHKLGVIFSRFYLHDKPIVFCYKLLEILKAIEEVNNNKIGMRMSFIILEQLKLKYQKMKYR